MVMTNEQLYLSLGHLRNRLRGVNYYQYYCLDLLISTGLRYIEAYEIDRWVNYDVDNYSVQCAKGGNIRYISKLLINEPFKKAIADQFCYFDYFRKSNLEKYIRENLPYRNITIGDKGCSSHLFRYAYVRQLADLGLNASQIAENIGEVDYRNIEGYMFNNINYD